MGRDRLQSEHEEPAAGAQPAPVTAAPGLAALGGGSLDTQTVVSLQRSAGNSAVNSLLRAAVIHRSGCDCPLCMQGVRGGDHLDSAGTEAHGGDAESVGGMEDEEAEAEAEGPETEGAGTEEKKPAQGLLQRAIAQAAHTRRLARAATWGAGPVHQVNNLADCVINGTPAGVTWPTLNGTQFWSAAEALAALNRPTLTTAAAASGGGFESSVTTVPGNAGSFDETVLAPGPWRLHTTIGTVKASVPALPSTAPGGTATRFRAYGDPSDQAMFAANRRHEDKHAADHKAAFTASIQPWDQKLEAAKASGQKFNGATAAEAEAALWTHMGGTPEQVAADFYNRCQAAVIAYHGSAAGGTIGSPTRPGARKNSSLSWAHYTNPS